jgi:hypothetical protein
MTEISQECLKNYEYLQNYQENLSYSNYSTSL